MKQIGTEQIANGAIANSVTTCRIFDQNRVHIDRGSFLQKISLDSGGTKQYRRFRLTKNNNSYNTIDSISLRVPLGTENEIFWNTGDEHDEEGHISEDPNVRTTMMNKRMGKLKIVLDEIGDNIKAILHGIKDPNALTVISWGFTKGAILDAMDKLIEEEKIIRFVQLRLLHPFPSERVKALIDGYNQLVDIEMSYSSQLASLINENLSIRMDYLITKYNSRPMSCTEIYDALARILSGDAPRRIILERGV
jgi:2-oxoglutarate ferredoxin oxidoreductase subunit alpha